MSFLLAMIRLGLGNLWLHRLRSLLTALGIIFGVAAVITMVSIGEGSKRQALARIENLGAKNIIIRSKKPPETAAAGGQQRSRSLKYGLTRDDVRIIAESLPGAEAVVALKEVGAQVAFGARRRSSQVFGVTPALRGVAKLRIARGRYLAEADMERTAAVAVIGSEIAAELYPFDDPLESTIQVDRKVFRIVGVLAPIGLSGGAGTALVGRDLNFDVHLPLTTASTIFGDHIFKVNSGSREMTEVQVSELYIAAPSRDDVLPYAALMRRILEVRHEKKSDVTIIVPHEMLENARREAQMWQMVLSFIAGISLLIGGIGIMNIMLASVTERTREIGIRRALGATRRHITQQFLVETGVLSLMGGLVGVGLGVGLSLLLGWAGPIMAEKFRIHFELATRITPWSIALAFSVAAVTGLVFGIYPAIKAARQDPIVALRHD